MNMARGKVGALIVIERGAPLNDIADTGERMMQESVNASLRI